MNSFTMGDLRFTVLRAGELWLDGGAMFGVVPKVMWERERPSDEKNRIRLAMNILPEQAPNGMTRGATYIDWTPLRRIKYWIKQDLNPRISVPWFCRTSISTMPEGTLNTIKRGILYPRTPTPNM